MKIKIIKLILIVSLIFQAGCDITFKRNDDSDNRTQVKSGIKKSVLAKKVDIENAFTKKDRHIISSYYSDKANSIIRKDMIMHTKISKKQESKIKIGKFIPRNVQVIPLPLKLERILSSLPLHTLRVQVGVRVIIMNVKSRKILDIIKI